MINNLKREKEEKEKRASKKRKEGRKEKKENNKNKNRKEKKMKWKREQGRVHPLWIFACKRIFTRLNRNLKDRRSLGDWM